jgi:hypothetical protein
LTKAEAYEFLRGALVASTSNGLTKYAVEALLLKLDKEVQE